MRKTSRRRRPTQAPERVTDTAPAVVGRPDDLPSEPRDRASESSDVVAEFPSPVERVTLPLTSSGRLDLDRVRASTREKLTRMLDDPDLSAKLGIAPQREASAPAVFDASICGVLYDAIGRVLALVVIRSGFPPDQAGAMLFTADEKAALAGPTGKVLDKYLGSSTLKYQDEIALCLALGSVLTGKLGQLKKPGTVIDAADRFPQQPPAPESPAS